MGKRRHFLASVVLGLASVLSANSAVAAETATDFAERTSASLVEIIEGAQEYYKTDPEKLQAEIGGLLDTVVDFQGISRIVMGKYYAKADSAQQEAFIGVFRDGLVNVFSKALAGFGGLEIEVLAAKGSKPNKKSVDMIARSKEDGTKVGVRYSLLAKSPGDWIIRNVIFEGVNLGKTYRSQFDSSMRQNGNDVDAVIAGWSEIDAKK